jgi:undecaprenyl-diphosphatase
LFFLGILIFGILTFNVMHQGPLTALDQPIAQTLHQQARHGPWPILLIAWFFSATGREGIILFMLILTIIWVRQHHWREVAMLLLGVGGGEFLFQVLGGMIGRHRPVFPDPLEVLTGPGFPSGHTTTSILLFGLFLYLLWHRLPSNTWRAVGVLLVIFMVSAIGAARMFIGDHYLTDIISGAALGTAWAGLIYTTIEMVSWRRAHPEEQPDKHRVTA